MWKMWTKIIGTAALTFMLCLTGLVMSGEAQAERFVDNGNGTVTDTQTGLMWTQKAVTFERGFAWDVGKSNCEGYGLAGLSGWRLPTINELKVQQAAIEGGAGNHPFTWFSPGLYWSSDADPQNSSAAWTIHMQLGYVLSFHKDEVLEVWCVRNAP